MRTMDAQTVQVDVMAWDREFGSADVLVDFVRGMGFHPKRFVYDSFSCSLSQ